MLFDFQRDMLEEDMRDTGDNKVTATRCWYVGATPENLTSGWVRTEEEALKLAREMVEETGGKRFVVKIVHIVEEPKRKIRVTRLGGNKK